MSNRIDAEFLRLKENGKGGFIPFIVAGDPRLEASREIIFELSRQGASVIEVGVPFSDPVADGVTIQAAAERALRHRVTVGNVLEMIGQVRAAGCETPIILFSYFNPILQFGLPEFVAAAVTNGVDGILVTDLVPEEADEFRELLSAAELRLIMLAAPTSSDERLTRICAQASGFVYAVSRTGVTGAQQNLSGDAATLVARIRAISSLPVAVGFGISTAAQVQQTWAYADAAVVGSALVAELAKLGLDASTDEIVARTREFTTSLLPPR